MVVIKKSNPNKPVRVMVYGVEGVGKSTLGAKSEKPIFLSPEGGSDQLTDINGDPIDEIDGLDTWDKLIEAIKWLTTNEHGYKTAVFDSADWIESLCHAKIIGPTNKSISTIDGGYGAGYRKSQAMHKDLIDQISILRDKCGMNIVVTAHAHVKAVKDPGMMEDYDSFEIKCHEMVSSLWREWVDGLFFVRFNTFVKTSDDTTKARAMTDGTRVIYTVKQPAFQAKNRYGMPPELEFTPDFWKELVKYAKGGIREESIEQVSAEIDAMILKLDDQTKETVVKHLSESQGNVSKLVAIRNRLRQLTGEK